MKPQSISPHQEDLLYPLLVLLAAPAIILLGSKLSEDNWTSWLGQINSSVMVTFWAAIMLWSIFILIKKRIRYLNSLKNKIFPFYVVQTPVYGYCYIGELLYQDLKWRIKHPNDTPWNTITSHIKPQEIEIDLTPHCPECDTELSEKRTFWGSYQVTCVKCGFHKSRWHSYQCLHDDVKKIAKSDFEKRLNVYQQAR